MRKLYSLALITALSSALVACGGKKTSTPTPPAPVAPAPPTPVNTAPTAVISAQSTTVEEGDTVELDSASSSDPENDTLIYHWVQTAGRDLRITDRATAQQSLRVPDLDMDETVEFELTVSDGALTDVTTQTITITNVEQMPKMDAPTFDGAPTELRFDAAVEFVSRQYTRFAYDPFYAVLDTLSSVEQLSRIIIDGPGAPEIRALFLDEATGDLRFTNAAPLQTVSGPSLSEQRIEGYRHDRGAINGRVSGDNTSNFNVGFDLASEDMVMVDLAAATPIEADRTAVPGACHFIGEIQIDPAPDTQRRYFAVGLTSGGFTLLSAERRFGGSFVTGVGARFSPDVRTEATLQTDTSFCGPSVTSWTQSGRFQYLWMLDRETPATRFYSFVSDGTIGSVRTEEQTGRVSQIIDFGGVPNLTFRDGFIRSSYRGLRQDGFRKVGDLIGVWSDGERDGEHRLVLVDPGDKSVTIKSWDKGVPSQVRYADIGRTSPGTTLPTFPADAVRLPDGSVETVEPPSIVILTPNTPDLVVFKTGAYGYFRLEFRANPNVPPFKSLRFLPPSLPSDAEYIHVGLDASDFDMLMQDRNRVTESTAIVFFGDQQRLEYYPVP